MEFPTIDKFAKEVAEKALDEITYEGKTVREWTEIIVKQQPCDDCISRQAVIQIIENKLNPCTDMFKCLEMSEIKEDVEHLPSVTPERPKGKWLHIYKSDIACECSVCHIQMPITEYFHYCPNCGSYNGGNDNGDE